MSDSDKADLLDKLKDKLIDQLVTEKEMYKSISSLNFSYMKRFNEEIAALILKEGNEDDEYARAICDVTTIMANLITEHNAILATIIQHNTGIDHTKYPEEE